MKKMPPFVAPVKNNLDSASSQNGPSDQQETFLQDNFKSTQDITEIDESIIEKLTNTPHEKKKINIEDQQKLIKENYTKVKKNAYKKIVKQTKNGKSNPKNKIIDDKIKKPKNVPLKKAKKEEHKLGKNDVKEVDQMESSTSKDKIKNKKIKLTEKKTKINSLELVQDVESMTQTFSQNSNFSTVFRELILSQPPKTFTHKQKLVWLQERRQVGVWVECCRASCRKWRYIQDIHDPLQIPEKWYCEMNSDTNANSCSKKEIATSVLEEEDLIHAIYSAGSLVWALLDGFPWWPAMVDDCPDTEQYYWLDGFSDIPTYYNVTFFDSTSVTRAWIATEKLKPYILCGKKVIFEQSKIPASMVHRMKIAKIQVDNAVNLTVLERLRKYSFVTRYEGPINSPKGELVKKCTKRLCESPKGNSSDPNSVSLDSDSDSSDLESDKSTYLGKEQILRIFGIENLKKSPPDINHMLPTYQEIATNIDKDIISRKNMLDSGIQQDKLFNNSACSGSKEALVQPQMVCTQNNINLISQDIAKSVSFSNPIHSNTCMDMSDAVDCEKTETENIDLTGEEETEEAIFQNLCTSDAIVPSTETNVVDLNLDSEILSQKSLDFEMF